MLDWPTVESAQVGDDLFILGRQGDDWVVRVHDRILMTNRLHDSEIALADEALSRIDEARHVLVGGLGLGYTLRAVLDLIEDDARVTVAELVPELVEWNRKHVGVLNDQPLADPRCDVAIGDVFDLIRHSPRTFDAMLLDVDNGPRNLAQVKNQRLYSDAGVRYCLAALKPGGILAVWSNAPNAKFAKKLERIAGNVEVLHVATQSGHRLHATLFLSRL